MESFLQKEFLNNSVRDYLMVLGIILLALLIKRVISKYAAGLIYKLFSKAGKTIHRQSFFALVIQPLDLFLFLLISFIAIDKLNYPELLDIAFFKTKLKTIIDCVATTTLIIVFIWFCLRLIDFVAIILEDKANQTKDLSDNQLIVFFKDFFKVIIVLVGILIVLRFGFGRNVGNLLTGLSIVGAAIALATKESLENLIASFIIFFDKPFITGDLIKVNGFTGTVERIGLRSTRVRTDVKTFITIPNKQMVDTILDNISLRTQRKGEIRIEIGLSTSSATIRELKTEMNLILKKYASIESFQVFLTETGKNAHVIAIDYFTEMPQPIDEFNELKENINFAIIDLLAKTNVELAAANTDIVIHKNE